MTFRKVAIGAIVGFARRQLFGRSFEPQARRFDTLDGGFDPVLVHGADYRAKTLGWQRFASRA